MMPGGAAAPSFASTASEPGGLRQPAVSLPRWLERIDAAVLALLNVVLLTEVAIVFVNTLLRAFVNATLIQGIEETSRLTLIVIAFLGGAVAYGRDQFMAKTFFVDKASPHWRDFFAAAVEWVVVLVALLIGGYSIPLQILNAGERTTLLGIGYVWMTLPITIGTALFILHAGLSLRRRSPKAALAAAAAVALTVLAIVISRDGVWVDTS